ncbi:ATP-dependent metallopeptidase FtsH/Yme1/Tma family protein [Trichlorobacter lovleyi]|uniref:ATP-dependent zinc metalloprotease FtsH n=1 Tax=Trichlorobacter lovleyi TaxID=313985 RepID=UPI002ACD3904|nr:ATP-dependent zinc metalloprotease FtsH [Trichlorobacter lovleyi]QOX79508.1 ATP-dependent metallopeptidase FtsH/Yme1/Tma family protein [Trichlorobacter lovleyi]
MNQFYKNLALWLVISLMMIMLFNMFQKPRVVEDKLSFSEFMTQIDDNRVKSVILQGNELTGKYLDKDNKEKAFRSYKPTFDADLTEKLLEKKITIQAKPEEERVSWFSIFISWFPLLLLVGIWIFFMRQMQMGGGKAMSFGKSRAKLLTEAQGKITFEDVAGIEEAKEELEEIIAFLKEPKKFTALGGKIPKGVLLVGPPGTGKTLLARAVAGEAGVPFFSISGSDFVEMFVGVGASRVRDLFLQGKKNAPCIIFIDEIDAVGRHRGAGLGGGHDEREQTLNQLLVEMDGFESNEGVILIAATNRPDVLDPALLRPGRFDRQVVVPRPDVKGREQILTVHAKKVPLTPEVDLGVIARGTPGFSGADLANLVNEAALLAARGNKTLVDMQDFDAAKDKVLMGAERRSMVISDEEKKSTAYHEAGHTLVAKMVPGSDPVHKVSIIPRGRALGVTMQLPIEDKHSYNRESLLGRIAVLMGGRAAEELIFKTFTTGAGNDIERATEMARKMVCEWGMSDLMGPVSLGKKDESIFLGRDMAMHKNFSEETAIKIDEEIKRIVDESYTRAITILREHEEHLHQLSLCLIEKENLTGAEVDDIIAGKGPVCTGKKADEPAKPAAEPAAEAVEEPQKPVDIQA